MNKKVLISLAGAALLSAGLTTAFVESNTSVDAAKTTLVKGKHKKLARNARIYTSKGKKTKKKTLKKGKKLKILGFKTIKGKKYVRIGKNQYVLAVNFKAKKAKKHVSHKKNNTNSSTDWYEKKYHEKAPAYVNEPEYRKYLSWIEGHGDIIATKNTEGMSVYSSAVWARQKNPVWDPDPGDNPISAGEKLMNPSDVYKVNGKYYLETYDEDDAGLVLYKADDFKYEEPNFASSAYKSDLEKDSKLKSLSDAYVKTAKKNIDDEVVLSVTKNAEIYVNNGSSAQLKLVPEKSINKGTIIYTSNTPMDESSYGMYPTRIIKYNNEYYYVFYDFDAETINSYYIKASDVKITKTLDKYDTTGYFNKSAINTDDDDDD